MLRKLEKHGLSDLVNKLRRLIENEETPKLKDALFKFCQDEKIGMGVVMQTLRIAVVVKLSGPDIMGVINIIGKNSTLDRLKKLKVLT